MSLRHVPPRQRVSGAASRGFSMLEVLISVLVLAIGLLGLAGLQTMSLKYSHGAYVRSQAVQLAYDMADRIRANLDAVAAYDFSASGFDGTDMSVLPADPGCVTTGCSGAQLANYDFRLWNHVIRDTLPGGFGLVTLPSADEVEIAVSWIEQVDLDDDGVPDTQTFQMRFAP